MNIYFTRLNQLELLAFSAGFVAVILIILYLIVENKPRQIIMGRGGEQRFLPNTKDYIGRLVGMFGITALAVLANHWSVYILSLIVIATLVTDTDFLVRIVALIWDRKEYWEYETTVVTTQQTVLPQDPKVEIVADQVNQDPNGLSELLSQKEKELSRSLLNYHFERVYRLIYGSQLLILDSIRKMGTAMPLAVAETIYKNTPWSANYPFEQYLNFLEEAFLIERKTADNHKSIELLPMGYAFLEYLDENRIPLEKQPF